MTVTNSTPVQASYASYTDTKQTFTCSCSAHSCFSCCRSNSLVVGAGLCALSLCLSGNTRTSSNERGEGGPSVRTVAELVELSPDILSPPSAWVVGVVTGASTRLRQESSVARASLGGGAGVGWGEGVGVSADILSWLVSKAVRGVEWACEAVTGVGWASEAVMGVQWACEAVMGVEWACEAVKGVEWSCEAVRSGGWASDGVRGVEWVCRAVSRRVCNDDNSCAGNSCICTGTCDDSSWEKHKSVTTQRRKPSLHAS